MNEALLEERLAQLEKLQQWSPRVIAKLESLIASEDPWALFRVNPYTFAAERGIADEEAVDLLLLAAKVGIFRLNWSLLCPSCGDAVERFSTLQSVCSAFHCGLCETDIRTSLDDYVHVSFTISSDIRSIPAHDPASLSIDDYYQRYRYPVEGRVPGGNIPFRDVIAQGVIAKGYVEPHARKTFECEVGPGVLAVYDATRAAIRHIVVSSQAPAQRRAATIALSACKLGESSLELAPGKLQICLDNDTAERAALVFLYKELAQVEAEAQRKAQGLEWALEFDRFLCGRKLLTSDTFRRAFGNEVIQSAEGLGVRDVSILFTDLKGSTALYDRIGDLKAFALVNQHFDHLGKAIKANHGAIVKTIGDAVMASFENPADAVRAARAMLNEVEHLNEHSAKREIILKIGVHRGASIAVTLNGRLDFFGQTVNVAARVQGLAESDEIYLTEEVYTAPGVQEQLRGMHVSADRASLRGVTHPVSVYRVAPMLAHQHSA